MNVRERQQKLERRYLSKYATLSENSKGRDKYLAECDIRTCFQRDRDRILHSKSFRRLKDKTQVFLHPKGDHYRTRLTHTLEVAQTARTIARALRLNEDLTEAIALGHDLGHTPFGHTGEQILNEITKKGFAHNKQSLRIVEKIENEGNGLNLTFEVRDGILNHKTSGAPSTLEGKVVRISDKIAYINSDIDDAIRAGILTEEDIPIEYRKVLGENSSKRFNTIIMDIVENSFDKNDIISSDEVGEALKNLRLFMFENVYKNPIAKDEEYKARELIEKLFFYYRDNLDELPDHYKALYDIKKDNKEQIVCDYISGMTDKFSIDKYTELFIPKGWRKI